MADATTKLELIGDTFHGPTLPGLEAPQSGGGSKWDMVSVQGSTQTSPEQTYTNLDQDDSPTQSVIWQWSFDENETWQTSTAPVAMVFGMKLVQQAAGSPIQLPPGFDPSSIFSIPGGAGELKLSTMSWADNTGIVPSSSFTYLIPPTFGAWSLNVCWDQVVATGLATSYRTASRLALALKYRLYCYTPSFGLWYVDPELDLCPQPGG